MAIAPLAAALQQRVPAAAESRTDRLTPMVRLHADFNEARAARTLAHPLRLSILWELELGPASPRDLARRLGARVEAISYHVRKLAEVGFIEPAGEELGAGTVRHLYRLAVRPRISEDAWAALSVEERRALNRPLLRRLTRAAAAALEEGGFDRPQSLLGRAGLILDEQGFAEVHDLLTETHCQLAEIEQRAARRLTSPGARRCDGTVVSMLFETPTTESAPQRVEDLPELPLWRDGSDPAGSGAA